MKASEIPALREKLTKACDEKIAQGYYIMAGVTFGTFTSGSGTALCCCPIGAATEERFLTEAAGKLGISYEDANRFANGFDGNRPTSNMARLGAEFHKKYIGSRE